MENFDKKKKFNDMINNGVDRVTAYQRSYGVTYEEAVKCVNEELYYKLISAGLSPQMAREAIIVQNLDTTSKTK
jgi:hypothetical protein